MQEVTRACRDCKSKEEVFLKSENASIQNAFKRGPDNHTYKFTDDDCEVCGADRALKKQ
jgi:hypothetical protein